MAGGTAAARDPSELPRQGREVVLAAALEAFFEQGFHGTSMRNIAARAGTAVSHAYYYFPSKTDLLRALIFQVTEDLRAALAAARAAAGPDPAAQLAAMVRAHVALHTERQAESFVGNTELRSLDERDRDRAVALRDAVGAMFREVVGAGMAQGTFHIRHREEAVLAIMTMCTAVAGWYRAGGPLRAEAIGERYASLALNMLGWQGVEEPRACSF